MKKKETAVEIEARIWEEYNRRCDRITGPRQGGVRVSIDVKATERLSFVYLRYLRDLKKGGVMRNEKGEWVYR